MTSRRDFIQLLATGTLAASSFPLPSRGALAQSRADTVRVAWPYDTSSLDAVGIGAQRSTWCISLHVYDRLVTYDTTELENGTRQYIPSKVTGELAESWQVSPDGKKITFTLKAGAKFHDGTPVTAEDVRWSIERSLNVKGAAGVMRVGGLTKAEQLRAVDERTFEVTLDAPNRYAVLVFTIPFAAVINATLAKRNATPQDPWANEWLKHNAAGGGAYKVESFRSDQVVLSRFDGWVSGPKPAIQQAVFQTVTEAATRGALVERSSADVALEILPNDFAKIAERDAAQAIAIPMPNEMDFVAMNSGAAPFDDVRVRQAVAYSLPYEQIFQAVFRNRGRRLFGAKDIAGGRFPEPSLFDHDVAKAKSLLAEAGRAQGFETSLVYSAGKAAYFDPLALAIRDSLGQIGIKATIERLPGAQFDERIAARSAPMVIENRIAWLSLPDYWFTAFYSGNSTSNLGNYHSDRLAAMLKNLPGDASPRLYDEATQEMAKLVLTEVPMVPIRQGAVEVVLAKGIRGYTYSFHGLPDVRVLHRA